MRAGQDDRIKRLRKCLSHIEMEDQWLGECLAYWSSKRRGGLLPGRADLDSGELLRLAKGRMHIVECGAEDPKNYSFRLYGSRIPLANFSNYTNFRLGDLPQQAMRAAAMEDYHDAAVMGAAIYQLVGWVQDFRHHEYGRLLLPLAGDGRRVDQLLVCVQERPIPPLVT